jgi:hypothetical protein
MSRRWSMNEEVVRRAISELAQALLYREYGKDMRNHDLIRLLAHEPLEKFAEATAPLNGASP